MKTEAFKNVIAVMSPTQQAACEELEKAHSDLLWDGGKVDTKPLRVALKNSRGNSMAAINTREKDAFLRFEFRSRDYKGPQGIFTKHKNFDKAYDLFNYSDIAVVSEILLAIKERY